MKTRLVLTLLAAFVIIVLAISLSPQLRSAPVKTATFTLTPTEKLPTRTASPTWPPISATSIPAGPTYTSIPGETPQTSASQTLLPIETPTLISSGSSTPPPIATATLVFFASPTLTPFGGTATPPVPIAYALDGKPHPCYKGPSRAYIELDTFTTAEITGKDKTGKWWFLVIYKGEGVFVECWVTVRQVRLGGNLEGLPVTEPGLSQLTEIKLSIPGQPAAASEYVQNIACDEPEPAKIRISGQIYANGPIEQVGYAWQTDALTPLPEAARAPIFAWNAPAQADLDLSVPSQPGKYSISLRTTFPMEISATMQLRVQCLGN